jgi:K+-sensing histidine kinase KdpD
MPGMLEQFGKPYQSSKGRPGGGLGLFLVVNVARTVGGRVAAHNRPEGGAIVKITAAGGHRAAAGRRRRRRRCRERGKPEPSMEGHD